MDTEWVSHWKASFRLTLRTSPELGIVMSFFQIRKLGSVRLIIWPCPTIRCKGNRLIGSILDGISIKTLILECENAWGIIGSARSEDSRLGFQEWLPKSYWWEQQGSCDPSTLGKPLLRLLAPERCPLRGSSHQHKRVSCSSPRLTRSQTQVLQGYIWFVDTSWKQVWNKGFVFPTSSLGRHTRTQLDWLLSEPIHNFCHIQFDGLTNIHSTNTKMMD